MASIFNTVEVNTGRVARVLNFVESSDDFYVALGKPTDWDGSFGLNINDSNPPEPPVDAVTLPEPIVYKKVEVAAPASRTVLCQEFNTNVDALSSIILVQQSLTEQNYAIFDPSEVVNPDGSFAKEPELVYIKVDILGTDYAADEWRASALFTKLFLEDGVPTGQTLYQPSQVKGGLLHHLTYNTPVERTDDKIHKFEYLINV